MLTYLLGLGFVLCTVLFLIGDRWFNRDLSKSDSLSLSLFVSVLFVLFGLTLMTIEWWF